MLVTLRWLGRPRRLISLQQAGIHRTCAHPKHDTDDCQIPTRPTWSVNKLLSSYPKPSLSSVALTRLCKLSALIPPKEGTSEHVRLKGGMEEFISVVEAVKLVDTKGIRLRSTHSIEEIDRTIDRPLNSNLTEQIAGKRLLLHASRTSDGFYVVDSDKKI